MPSKPKSEATEETSKQKIVPAVSFKSTEEKNSAASGCRSQNNNSKSGHPVDLTSGSVNHPRALLQQSFVRWKRKKADDEQREAKPIWSHRLALKTVKKLLELELRNSRRCEKISIPERWFNCIDNRNHSSNNTTATA